MRIWVIVILLSLSLFLVLGEPDRNGRGKKNKPQRKFPKSQKTPKIKFKKFKFGKKYKKKSDKWTKKSKRNKIEEKPQRIAPQFRVSSTADGYVVKQREGNTKGGGGFGWPANTHSLTAVKYPSEGSIAPYKRIGGTKSGDFVVKELEGTYARGRAIGVQWEYDGSALTKLKMDGRSASGIVATKNGKIIENPVVHSLFEDGGVATRGTYKVKPKAKIDELFKKEMKKIIKKSKGKGSNYKKIAELYEPEEIEVEDGGDVIYMDSNNADDEEELIQTLFPSGDGRISGRSGAKDPVVREYFTYNSLPYYVGGNVRT